MSLAGNFNKHFPSRHKRVHIVKYDKNQLYIEIGWHEGRKLLFAEIFVASQPKPQTRYVWSENRRDLFAQIRLALSRGLDDIFWDRQMMQKLTGVLR